MFTPSTPLALIWATVLVTVTPGWLRAAHMWGVPGLKSCLMIVRTTLVPWEWAVETRLVNWLEFHTEAPWSAAKVPSSLTWRPKKATVLRSLKFQVGYPTVGSLRLEARAKPNTSRLGPSGASCEVAVLGTAAAG